MSDPVRDVANQIERIKHLVPEGEDPKTYLAGMIESQISALAVDDGSMGVVPITPVAAPLQALASARIAVEMLEEPQELLSRPEGIVDLGTIEWVARPALLFNDYRIEPPHGKEWASLPTDIVATPARSVCRIDIGSDEYGFQQVGTGFLVGEADAELLVLTNRHVVEEAVLKGWPNAPQQTLACDFDRLTLTGTATHFKLAAHFEIHPCYDLALLYLPKGTFSTGTQREVLTVAAAQPANLQHLRIGVIGHPWFDSRRDPFPRYFGFGNQFGVKRLSPGYVRAIQSRLWLESQVEVALHDATTLSGSSGSCILDLDTMQVVGLHFGGWPMQPRNVSSGGADFVANLFSSNGAVPLWKLHNDPLLAAVNFA